MNDKLCIEETVRSIGERISEQLKNSIFHKHVEEKHGRAVQQRPINRYSVISFSIRSADSLTDYSIILKSKGIGSPKAWG